MNQIVVGQNKNDFIKLVFIKIIEFGLFYLRNIFLVGAASFIFLALVVILTFYQDGLGIDPISPVFRFLNNIPLIGDAINITDRIQADGDDIARFFLKASFYLTIFTEVLRYIKIYVFRKKVQGGSWKTFYRRIIFSITGISVIYSFSCVYVILSTGGQDVVGFLVVFIVFWIICCITSIAFLFIDFIAKNLHKVIDRINTTPINSVE